MKRFLPGLMLVLAAACSSLRWEGGGPHEPRAPAAPAGLSATPRQRTPDPVVPPATELQEQTALYDSDLGPDAVDVSSYPIQQRRNYRVYEAACSRCHGLARSINAPPVSRTWWEFYVASMRARGSLRGRPISREEKEAVLDFLAYDSHERKVLRAKEFEKVREELRRRYDALMDERLERLQRGARPAER
jgi:hypothetical protein